MEPIKLKSLLRGIENINIRGSKEKEVRRICNDSRRAAPGDLFIARKTEHAEEAIQAGAAAIVTEYYNPFLSVPQIITSDISFLEAELGRRFYKDPSRKLHMLGVTGTNGKTTTTTICKALWDGAGYSSGLIGTLGYQVGDSRFDPTLTTPDILTNLHFLSEMVKVGQKSCCMEVSSHALSQDRVVGIEFDIAIFTQLTPDHLDYHKTMEEYASSKKKLFQSLGKEKVAILNADCPYSTFMQEDIASRVVWYGIDRPADLQATDLAFSSDGISFTLLYQNKNYPITSPLLGKFNVYNLLASIAAAMERKIEIPLIQKILSSLQHVPGRMQKVGKNLPISVYVDFAHTEDSLKRALFTLRQITNRRIITVFGCGGCRYPQKRKQMGKISSELSDLSILTNDNPRTEDPMQIIEEIKKGFAKSDPFIEPDRGKAIEKAIFMAEEGDLVLIAGKGAEKMQIFAHTTHPWDDCVAAEEALKKKYAHTVHTA